MDEQIAEIVWGLVGKGLSREQAERAFYHFLEYQLEEEKRRERRAKRLRWVSRLASLVIAGIHVAIGFYLGGKFGAVLIIRLLPFPLVCIWMPEPMGSRERGSFMTGYVRPTPTFFVALGGWLVLLVCPTALLYVLGDLPPRR
jgi:hypothetical protein